MDTTPNNFAYAAFAAALADAHAGGEPVVVPQGALPATVSEGMSVQTEVTRRLGARVGGWKVGAGPERISEGAPIYTHLLRASGASFPLRKSGLWGVEPEFGVRLRADLPPRPAKPYTREEIVDAIDAMFAGIEILASRVVDFKAVPHTVFLADNIGNAGYVTGPDASGWRGLDLSKLRATLTIDGETVHDAVGGHTYGDPLQPLIDFANAPCDGLGGLKAGHVITTGSLCGLVPVTGPCEAVLVIEGLGEVRVRLE